MCDHGAQLGWKGHELGASPNPLNIPCKRKLEYPEKTHDVQEFVG